MKALYGENREYKRIFEIDFIRGICILLVMLDHLMYNFAVCYVDVPFFISMRELGVWYWYWGVRVYVRYLVLAIFFLISGVSSSFSKNNVIRGLKMLGFAVAMSVVTYIASYVTGNPKLVIDFSFILVFALSILIFGLVANWKNWQVVVISVICIFLAWYIPTLEVQTFSKLFLPIGIKPVGYQCADYSSMFPWVGFFFIGGVLGRIFYPQRKSLFGEFKPKFSKPILHMGRQSLYYYFGEMIVLMPIFYAFTIIFA